MRTRTTRLLLAAATLVAFTAPAFAQVRQLQLGNPMDANPGVNSGGTNAPIPGYVPINGNDIMTGNVSGLSYFHGTSVPNPYQFQGNLPSASLNNFARESAPLQPNGSARPYYLPSSSVSSGQGSIYSAPIGGGFDSRLVPSRAFSPIATPAQLSAAPGMFTGEAYDRQPAQIVPLDATAQGGLLNNPLFMLRTTEALARQAAAQTAGQTPGQPTTLPASLTTQPADTDTGLNNGVEGSMGGRVSGQSPEIIAAHGTATPLDERVGSVYASLAVELKKAEGAEGEKPASNQLVAAVDIDPLTGRPRLKSAAATAPASGTAGPLSGGSEASGTATQPTSPFARPGDVSAKPLEGVSSAKLTAGSNVKPLQMAAPTSAGLVPTAFDVLMVRAQTEMKDGKYVDAQLAYQTALANKPDDPLALVGLADAELASGAYTSAAYDLKFAFTRKPEMAAVRYSADSFIPAARQDYLLDDLLKQTSGKDAANMASFLYCYVCYQTGRTTELQAELKKWADRPGHDSWADVATRAWTK